MQSLVWPVSWQHTVMHKYYIAFYMTLILLCLLLVYFTLNVEYAGHNLLLG